MEPFIIIGAALGILAFGGVIYLDIRSNRDVEKLWRNIVGNTSVWSERYWQLRTRVDGHDKELIHLFEASKSQAKVNEIWLRHLEDHTFAIVAPKPRRISRARRGKGKRVA